MHRTAIAIIVAAAAITITAPGCVIVPPVPPTTTRVRFEPVASREVTVSFVRFERQTIAQKGQGPEWIADRTPHAVVAFVRGADRADDARGATAAPLVEASFAANAPSERTPGITCRDDALIVGGVVCPLALGDLVVVRADADGRATVLAQGSLEGDASIALYRSPDELVAAVGRALREAPAASPADEPARADRAPTRVH